MNVKINVVTVRWIPEDEMDKENIKIRTSKILLPSARIGESAILRAFEKKYPTLKALSCFKETVKITVEEAKLAEDAGLCVDTIFEDKEDTDNE